MSAKFLNVEIEHAAQSRIANDHCQDYCLLENYVLVLESGMRAGMTNLIQHMHLFAVRNSTPPDFRNLPGGGFPFGSCLDDKESSLVGRQKSNAT